MFEGLRFLFFAKGTYKGITVASKSVGPEGLPSDKFAGPQASLWAIGPRARLILTPESHTLAGIEGTDENE